jgi:hypothetical protein
VLFFIQKKIWIAGAILSLMIILLFLIKFIFSILLLVLASVLISTYFMDALILFIRNYIFQKMESRFPLLLFFNYWFFLVCRTRLQQEAAELSDASKKQLNI